MRKGARLAALLLAGAVPGAAFSAAQPDDVRAAAGSAPPYALVSAREREWRVGGEHTCVRVGAGPPICAWEPSAGYGDARSLAGRPVAPGMSASSRVRSVGWYRPVLLLVMWNADGVPVVVAQAMAGAAGRACIPAAEFDRLGWRPSGPDIAATEGGLCADLSALAALPVPPIQAVVSISAEEFRVEMDRERRLQRRRRRR